VLSKVTSGGSRKTIGCILLVKASRDVTFSDGHHELENVIWRSIRPRAKLPIRSLPRAPSTTRNNVLSFVGNVKIETKDKLKVATEALSFDQNSGVAQTDSRCLFRT
jgi:hypothetical protein